MSDQAPMETESELAAFRQRWREEVSARNKKPESYSTKTQIQRKKNSVHVPSAVPGPSTARRKDEPDHEEFVPAAYHDLPNKDDILRLGTEGQNHDREGPAEPESALEHYEKAVEKESHGQLGDSLKHYRKAFRLDTKVQEAYSKKHFPQSSFVKSKPTNLNPSNAAVSVPGTAHHSLDGSAALPATLKQLIESFSTLAIEPALPLTDASPQETSPMAELPEEILTQILHELAVMDLASFARTAQVCKRLAYLILTEEPIWKRVALGSEIGFGAMHYDFVCDLGGFPISANDTIARYPEASDPEIDSEDTSMPPNSSLINRHTTTLLKSTYTSSYRQLLRSRPRLRFNGCYISTVNYTRAGANSTNTLSWGSTPVHVVTYFRYLRFFRDGTVISLLTTVEPADVVHHLTKANLEIHHAASSALPSAVMRDALRGRWRLSGPISSALDPLTSEPEIEGDVHIETQGVTPKYTYRLQLGLTHAGKIARNNKLIWKGFWSLNRLTEDWAEFGLRNDRAFWWSRVRSFEGGD